MIEGNAMQDSFLNFIFFVFIKCFTFFGIFLIFIIIFGNIFFEYLKVACEV